VQRLFVFVAHSLIFTDLKQRGACNQGKEVFGAKYMQSGATPPPLLLERMFYSGTKDYISNL